MDALICDDTWDPKPEVIENVKKEVDEVARYFDLFTRFLIYNSYNAFLSLFYKSIKSRWKGIESYLVLYIKYLLLMK
jgi:hypothetical protein